MPAIDKDLVTSPGESSGVADLAPEDNRPHYRRIYADIEQRILSGDLAFGSQLPVLPDLCVQYGVSEAPVRRALDELARAGLIVRQRGRGKGTFVHKRITPPTVVRVLLVGIDLQRSVIETCHEAFGLIAGIGAAVRSRGGAVQTVAENAVGSLVPPPNGVRVGYLVLSMFADGFPQGLRIVRDQNDAPGVLVNVPEPVAGVASVGVDMEAGAFLGTDYLARLGHTRIAYVGKTDGPWFAPRFAGYRRALQAHGLTFAPELARDTVGIAASEDAAALDALLDLPSPPTAIFACSDYRALHLMEHARNHRGLTLPRDLSLCGYDDIGACETVSPALTSIYHPLFEQGEAAVAMLYHQWETGAPPQPHILQPRLVPRDSCAPPGAITV